MAEDERMDATSCTENETIPGDNGDISGDITPKKDGGVLKEILKSGTGPDRPNKGNKVFVHYVGTLLDGSVFDSSRNRGEQFSFTLGKQQVIEAWDLGIASMRLGELAKFTCRGDYAYKESGSPPKIGPNETLIFEVELFSWKGDDISDDKDEGVLRSIMADGEGFLTPNDGATCEIHVKGFHEERVFQDEDIAFIVGEAAEVGIIDGIEIAIKKFKKNEKSKLLIKSKYAYGAKGSSEYNIPPNADLIYEITLNKFEKAKEAWEMDVEEKLEQSEIVKAKGTTYFKEGKYELAIRYYKKIVEFLAGEDTIAEEELKKRHGALLLAAHLNLAMSFIKADLFTEARDECEKAMELDPKNEKALFRRGTALMSFHDYDGAMADFQAVLEVDPSNKAAKNQLAICQHRIKQYKEKEKSTYKGMFSKFAEMDAKKSVGSFVRYSNGDALSDIGDWSNEMAKDMMPLDQEMAAFGEKMPAPKYNKAPVEEDTSVSNGQGTSDPDSSGSEISSEAQVSRDMDSPVQEETMADSA